jgi:hypothetical protein
MWPEWAVTPCGTSTGTWQARSIGHSISGACSLTMVWDSPPTLEVSRPIGARPGKPPASTYGLHVKSTPNGITGLMDGYTDWAADFQYDRIIPQLKSDVLSVRGTYIRENSTLLATFNAGGAVQTGHHLNTALANVEYHFGTKLSSTAGMFDITGTRDPLLFAQAAVAGSANGSPQSNGYNLNLSWWPEQNVDLGVQYTGYLRFNGAKTNYDGAGRDASANNTVFLIARFVF